LATSIGFMKVRGRPGLESRVATALQFRQGSPAMKTIPVEVSGGLLRLPPGVLLPPNAHLAVLALEEGDAEWTALADAGGAFDFLREEPELYSDADIPPHRRNPRFGGRG
jgi:hypothetical protein